MSFPAPGNAAVGEELRDEGGIRKALLNWFSQQGINPFQNPYAARLVGRAGEIANIMPGYFAHDDDRRNFINQWAAQNWGGAAPGGGYDFSRQGIINQIDQTRDINGTPTNLFRSGDSDADAQAIAAWRNIANRGYGSQIQNTAARLEAEKGLQFGAWRQQNPTWTGQYADWRLGKTPVTQGFTPPTSTSTGTGTGFTPPSTANSFTPTSGANPNPSTVQNAAALPYAKTATSSTAYGIGAAGPQGSLTPPIATANSVNPALVTFPSAPGPNPWESIAQNGAAAPTGPLPAGANANANTGTGQQAPTTITTPQYPGLAERQMQNPAGAPGTPGSNAAITNWKQLLDTYRGDQRNWGTRMMGHPSEGFSIGGITYNPQAEAAQGAQRYRNMSGQGRETARGSNWGVFLYRLDQLRNQRDRGGNAALGITAQTTDDQLARMAAQFVQKNYVGTSAFTGA